jgi:hypothetical protein
MKQEFPQTGSHDTIGHGFTLARNKRRTYTRGWPSVHIDRPITFVVPERLKAISRGNGGDTCKIAFRVDQRLPSERRKPLEPFTYRQSRFVEKKKILTVPPRNPGVSPDEWP